MYIPNFNFVFQFWGKLLLFNIYADEVFKEAPQEIDKGVKINGKYINNIRYADVTVLIADSTKALQLILDRVNEAGIRYGLKDDTKIIVSNNEIEKGRYLGCIII